MQQRILVLIIFLTTSFFAYGQAFDTTRNAIIGFNPKEGWPFDNTYEPTTLTQEELQAVDSFLFVCVTDFNNSLGKDNKYWSIDLKERDYRKQLVVAINNKGQKEVWVNCFCRIHDDRWKTQIVEVMDGGKCYFNFKLNLTLRICYDFRVNGVA
jgi:hypothetical protein